MDFNYTHEEIINLFKNYLYDMEVENKETYYELRFRFSRIVKDELITKTLTKEKIDSLIMKLKSLKNEYDAILYNEKYFESLIVEERNFLKPPILSYRNNTIEIYDHENKINYCLSSIKNEYLIWILINTKETHIMRRIPIDLIRRKVENLPEGSDVLDVLSILINLYSLKISSENSLPLAKFINYSNSFIFNLAFNFDSTFIVLRNLEEITNKTRMKNIRNTNITELDPPRRVYNEDLTRHYLLAISNESLNIQFLSYYHIMEHYFEDVFNNELIDQIKTKISGPNFSYKRKQDIQDLVKQIKTKLQIRNSTTTINEGEALKLVIKNFVDFENLKYEINTYDENLIDYYKNNKVEFSNGSTFDLSSESDSDRLVKDLANRIYSTRCALVHSKDGNKEKYIPFKDEKKLMKEIPLLRFIAEMVILHNSKEL
ncbi:hypothetical protein [Acinetobacter sp. 1000160]|uniref:hypothetical protein n=1 Tax=Acinetobacter sp. 1000160 TaxID=1310800 RepID=UPI0004470998|nr:hypothetical protein [Acinetobacter sp. 1000160]EYT17913.1 hypothetical protein J699_02757 [Acinetobacter sp. 1000160]